METLKSRLTPLVKARLVVFYYFTFAGMSFTLWTVHIPDVQFRFNISHAQIGTLIFTLGAGAIVVVPVLGHLIDHFGSKKALIGVGAILGVALILPGFAESLLTLHIAIFILGIGISSTDIAVNAHAVEVESAYGRPIFTAFHAMWSGGGVIGAGIGGFALAHEFPMHLTLTFSGITLGVIALFVSRYLLPSVGHTSELHKSFSKAEKSELRKEQAKANRPHLKLVLILGVLGCFAATIEGIGVDWSALFQVTILHATKAEGAFSVMVFSGAMALVRAFADRIVGRIGRMPVIRYGGVLSSIGMFLALTLPNKSLSLIGWLIVGIGVSAIAPQFFIYAATIGEASHSGRNMSKVFGLTYFGFLAGPAVIGLLASIVSLRAALGIGVLLGVIIAIATFYLPKLSKESTPVSG
jgi:MFS family permease